MDKLFVGDRVVIVNEDRPLCGEVGIIDTMLFDNLILKVGNDVVIKVKTSDVKKLVEKNVSTESLEKRSITITEEKFDKLVENILKEICEKPQPGDQIAASILSIGYGLLRERLFSIKE